MQSCGDMLIAEGRAEGLAQGMAQGEARGLAQGMARGKAEMVVNLLRHRFNGQVSERDESRVAGASVEELDLWVKRIYAVDSTEEVFDPRPKH